MHRHKSLHSRPRKILLIFTLLLALAAVVIENHAIYRRWMDSAVSRYFSHELQKPVEVVGTRVEKMNRLGFDAMTISNRDRETLMATGPGRMDFYGFLEPSAKPRVIVYSVKDVAVLEPLYKKLPIVSLISKYIFKNPVYLSEMKFVMTTSPSGTSLRILRFYSDEVWVMGGAHFENKKLVRANLLIAVPPASYEKLPKELRARMMRRKEGWRAVRITFGGNVFTAVGPKGPFFRASWS